MSGIPVSFYSQAQVLENRGKDKDLERYCPRCHREYSMLDFIEKVADAVINIVLRCRYKDCGHEWGVEYPLKY